ncbi:MAG: AtpZ/AtpI family protein [Polyangiaceae bacterium]|nr:AtpZ/AtpI family protein [Polyangiaceae bacterium]
MKQDWKGIGSYGTIGLEVVLSMLLGLFIGRWIDGKLGTEPIFSLIWFGFGIAAGVRSIVRAWKQMQAAAAQEEREQGNPAPLYEPEEQRKRDEEEAAKNARWKLDEGQAATGEDAPGGAAGAGAEPAKEPHER